jgi:hypothetical protein
VIWGPTFWYLLSSSRLSRLHNHHPFATRSEETALRTSSALPRRFIQRPKHHHGCKRINPRSPHNAKSGHVLTNSPRSTAWNTLIYSDWFKMMVIFITENSTSSSKSKTKSQSISKPHPHRSAVKISSHTPAQHRPIHLSSCICSSLGVFGIPLLVSRLDPRV